MAELHAHCQCDFCTGEDCELTKIDPDKIEWEERCKVLNKLEQLLCAHHKYVGSYRAITGTKEEIYDELFGAMQELRQNGEQYPRTEYCKNTYCPECPDSDTCSDSRK